jgi:hypothetical protein
VETGQGGPDKVETGVPQKRWPNKSSWAEFRSQVPPSIAILEFPTGKRGSTFPDSNAVQSRP